ncbi:MAG TPA: hypothetical protein VJS39_14495 [Gemmatimonadaceae bacterium]|nr:hypothetical protein [Gemmatimonadaceae bacterium]
MTEDNFEKFLKKTAQGYNTPPVRVPRDEMWAAIQAKRAAGPRVVYGGGSSATVTHERRFGTRVWLGAAAAAMLLVATGVGIGRWTASKPAAPVAANSSLPVQPVTVTPDQTNAGTTSPTQVATASGQTSRPTVTAGTANGGQVRNPAVDVRGGQSRVAVETQHPSSSSSSAYQLTAVQHLSETEALLTSFRSRSSADQQMDAQLGTWARQLLTNTRLLLDSPVGDDPQRRPLLQDLELVLVQIVQQLSPGSTPQDRELIEKTLQQDHVMTRLRTAIPAGAQRGS